MNFCNSVHLGKFVPSRAKLKINCLTVSQAAKNGYMQASEGQSIHASWPNKPHFVLYFYRWACARNDYIPIF